MNSHMLHCLLTGLEVRRSSCGKKKDSWHVSISVIDGEYTGVRVVEKVLKPEGRKKKRTKVMMLTMKWLRCVNVN